MPARLETHWTARLGVGVLLVAGVVWALRSQPGLPSKDGVAPATAKAEIAAASQDASGSQKYANRLIREKSPYLLMHAHNPVEWYAWGEEAFQRARREQKAIFLSIGYYTCHWCHVMERESFSDPAIAEIMNRSFISIKVDREERPDVDRIYMSFVQATTGTGGWPMSVFLTPELKPFFGATYFPKDAFRTLLLRVAEAWEKDRSKILRSADDVTRELQKLANAAAGDAGVLQAAVFEKTYEQIQASYDARYAGFGGAPKFPRPVVLNFLLRYYARTGKKKALEMALHTLRAMARGGIHDHLGGGFHRYSTDATWRVPHFEKMLYDQAQLAISYLEAYQISHDPFFADTARDVLEFVLREMRDPEGGFYSALDADSLIKHGRPEHGEGAFYVWGANEISQVLGADVAPIFNFNYSVQPAGNVPGAQDFRGEFKTKNILSVQHSIDDTARKFGRSEREVHGLLGTARQKLLVARSRRPRPPVDDKILTAWNGLAISALARGGQVLEQSRYLAAAEAATRFLHSRLYNPKTGQLKRRYRAGEAAVNGFLDDYAFLIQGLLDLYEGSFDVRWLTWAVELERKQDELFWDSKTGGYFTTSGSDPRILMQTREDYDGAEPSPNSVAAMNLLRLAQITDRQAWREKAQKTFAAFARRLQTFPEALPQMVAALDFSLSKPKQIIIAGKPDAPDTLALLRLVHQRYIPNKILMLADGGDGQKKLAQWLPFIQGVTRKQGRATAYICENYVCKLPTPEPQLVAQLLDGKT